MQKVMEKMWHRKKGFTLVELLIVVAIIGILVGIAIPNFLGARTRAKVAKSFADMDAIAKAEEFYNLDNGEYTESTSDLVNLGHIEASTVIDPWNRSYRICASPSDTPTMFVILGDGPDTKTDISEVSNWSDDARVRGAIGGTSQVFDAYGVNTSGVNGWYNPANGVTSEGDLGYGSG